VDFKLEYNAFMQRFPTALGRKISAAKLNELWQTMDHDMSGVIDFNEFSKEHTMDSTQSMVTMMKGHDATPVQAHSIRIDLSRKKAERPDSAGTSTTRAPDTRPVSALSHVPNTASTDTLAGSNNSEVSQTQLIKVGKPSIDYANDFERKQTSD